MPGQPVEQEGYSLLNYCWTAPAAGRVAERAGLTSQMVVRALENLFWQRDPSAAPANPRARPARRLAVTRPIAGGARLAEPAAPCARWTDDDRALDGIQAGTTTGTAQVRGLERCGKPSRDRWASTTRRARTRPRRVVHSLRAARDLPDQQSRRRRQVRCPNATMAHEGRRAMSFAGGDRLQRALARTLDGERPSLPSSRAAPAE